MSNCEREGERRFDPFRAARRFERMFSPGFRVDGPGEERMTPDEYREHKRRERQLDDQIAHMPEGELIATITYDWKNKKIITKWADGRELTKEL